MRKLLAAIVLAFVLGACATLSPQQQLAVAEKSFTEIVAQLTLARNEGLISDTALWNCAKTMASVIDNTFDQAHLALGRSQSIALYLGTTQSNVRALRRLYATGENICVNNSSQPSGYRRAPIGPSRDYRIQRDREYDADRRTYGTHVGRVEPHCVGA